MQPQKACDLRAAGWILPDGVAPEEHIRVYDTRIEQHWLHQMVLEAFPGAPSNLKLVGGDFLTRPLLTDTEALNPCRLRRWGPEGIGPYHLVVPPRPHQGAWLERAVQQLPLEDPESAITVCCILDRAACPDAWTREALCQSLPCCAPLVKAPNVQVRAAAVGERPPLLRVPANGKQLPPPKWDDARLAQNRVLLLLSIQQAAHEDVAFQGRWVRGQPPPPEPSSMELLRVEYLLPPAIRAQQAERSLRAALRKTAEAAGLAPLLPRSSPKCR